MFEEGFDIETAVLKLLGEGWKEYTEHRASADYTTLLFKGLEILQRERAYRQGERVYNLMQSQLHELRRAVDRRDKI